MTATASVKPADRAKKYQAKLVDERQLDLFGGDPFAVLDVIDAAEVAEAQVAFALEAAPSILPAATPDAGKDKETLDFARFMRNAGADIEDIREKLEAAGNGDPEIALERLQQIEQVLGPVDAQAPSVDEIADLADVVESGQDLDVDEDAEPEIAGDEHGFDADGDEDEEKKTKARQRDEDGLATSALGALLRRIRDSRYDPLNEHQEAALAARVKKGDQRARDELVERNIRFLVTSAKRFRYTGRPLDALVSFGVNGLIVAAEKFDPTRGRFTSCAALWIRQSIQRELQKDSLMKTPAYLSTKENKLKKAVEEATNDADRTKLSEQLTNVSAELKARRAMHVSMDGGGADDDSDGGGLHNMFASEEAGPEEQMEQRQLVTQMVKAAQQNVEEERAREIFLRRVGLHPEYLGEPQTLGEIAAEFDISRERVRQIYVEAATDVANAVIVWARGADNLPPDFKKKLVNPGRT